MTEQNEKIPDFVIFLEDELYDDGTYEITEVHVLKNCPNMEEAEKRIADLKLDFELDEAAIVIIVADASKLDILSTTMSEDIEVIVH